MYDQYLLYTKNVFLIKYLFTPFQSILKTKKKKKHEIFRGNVFNEK